jgi:NNP family nitrate/nitrite transporter-like MFS transporter
MIEKRQALSVLIVSTLAFTVCFMVWMMFGVIGIPIRKTLNLNATQFGLLTATPVLTGSLIRVPLGMWTDKFGGRIVLFLLILACVVPIWLIGYATEYWQFLALGLFVGLAGGYWTEVRGAELMGSKAKPFRLQGQRVAVKQGTS